MAIGTAPGLFGKLPSEGDFIQHDLPARFVRPWDDWLSHAMAASQQALGPAWADAYLLSPPWRFLLRPDVIGPTGWLGVLLSSVDRVRRYFPLTLALELPAGEAAWTQPAEIRLAMQALEQTALALIERPQPVAPALADVAILVDAALSAARAARPLALAWGDPDQSARLLVAENADVAPALNDRPASVLVPRSCWWHDRWNDHAAVAMSCGGLPPPATFAALLDGAWVRHGWRDAAGERLR